MWTAKTLIRLGRCLGWSESSLAAHSLCWFCHEVAHIMKSSWSIDSLFITLNFLRLFRASFQLCVTRDFLSHSTTKPAKWPVCPAKTQISLGIRHTLSNPHEECLGLYKATDKAEAKTDQAGQMFEAVSWSETSLRIQHILLVLSVNKIF